MPSKMKADMRREETVFLGDHPVEICLGQPADRVSITITPLTPFEPDLYASLLRGASKWVEQVVFDLYACVCEVRDAGTRITLEVHCQNRQEAVLRAVPSLRETLKLYAATPPWDCSPEALLSPQSI